MSKTSKLLAVSALALAAGFFGTTQLQAGQVLPGEIIIAQGAGGSGSGGAGAGGSGSSGDAGSSNNGATDTGSGNQLGDKPGTQQPVPVPGASRAPSSSTAGVPARCASITDGTQRSDCIRREQGSSNKR